jgi:gamma-glutamyltranspeptidase/glutathione hydrolase
MTPRRRAALTFVTAAAIGVPAALAAAPATAGPPRGGDPGSTAPTAQLPKVAVMRGAGGAVASVDRDASQIGIDVLRRGGTAADAAVATAAALGVTEPYSAGIGGGGFFVYYDARARKVSTIDGRETAPSTFKETTFVDPATGAPYPFATVVNSGLSIGTPGTPATWDVAARTWGKRSLSDLLAPAQRLAERGFVVDQTFHDQTESNAGRFANFPETARVFLPGGSAPAVGSTFRNPDMAKAYALLRAEGVDALYDGALGEAIVAEAQHPTTKPGTSVLPGELTTADLRAYRANVKAPVHSRYRGLDVYGMPTPSSGGIAVAEILNLLESYDERTGTALKDVSNTQYLHRFSEASATAFADRNRWVGDVPGVPTEELVSQDFADERACGFSEATAQARPIPFGNPDGSYADCGEAGARQGEPREGLSTTHLTAADKWGNVASYTLTIEQTGGSGITVPGYGLLLNNELTDFNFTPQSAGVPDPNLPGPGKRPRSSMSPTVILKDGSPWLAVGSPGGATIITSVAQTITEYVDRDLALVDAIAAPRLSSRNGAEQAEPTLAETAALRAMGHVINQTPEIGAVTGIRLLGKGLFEAAAEPTRRGGGSAMVARFGG